MNTPISNQTVNQTKFFTSADSSRELFYQTFEPKNQDTSAVVLITHGQGEHSEAYEELATYLCSHLSVKIYAWDLVGHGKSSGQRGYVGDISWLSQDFAKAVEISSSENTELPLFLLSHSLGGLIHLYSEQKGLLDQFKIRGSIFSNPCVSLNFTPPKWKSIGAELLTKLAPRVTLGNELKPSQLASDPEYLEKLINDPLRHNSISPRLYLGMLEMMNALSLRPPTHPTLTLLSPQDSVCAPLKSEAYLKDSSKLVFFEKSGHEVLNDIEKQIATLSIKDFINENS